MTPSRVHTKFFSNFHKKSKLTRLVSWVRGQNLARESYKRVSYKKGYVDPFMDRFITFVDS